MLVKKKEWGKPKTNLDCDRTEPGNDDLNLFRKLYVLTYLITIDVFIQENG